MVAAGELGIVTAVRIVYGCWLPPDWTSPTGAARQLARRPGPCRRRRADRPRPARRRPGRRAARRRPRRPAGPRSSAGCTTYPVDDGAVLAGRTAGGVAVSATSPSTPPTRCRAGASRWSAPAPQLVAEDTMGQTAGGRLTQDAADGTSPTCPSTPRRARSPRSSPRSPPPSPATPLAVAARARPRACTASCTAADREELTDAAASRTPAPTAVTGSAGSPSRRSARSAPTSATPCPRTAGCGSPRTTSRDRQRPLGARWRPASPASGSSRRSAWAPRGWVIETDAGLVGWEGAGFYPQAALDELRRRGGLVALGASHVHGYGALWQLQDELAPPVVADRRRRPAVDQGVPRHLAHRRPARRWRPAWSCTAPAGTSPATRCCTTSAAGSCSSATCSRSTSSVDGTPRRPVVPQGLPRADPAVARRDPAGPRAGRAPGVRRRRHAVRVRRAGVDQAGAGAVRPPAGRAADRRARSRWRSWRERTGRPRTSRRSRLARSSSSRSSGSTCSTCALHSAALPTAPHRRQRPRLRRDAERGPHRRARRDGRDGAVAPARWPGAPRVEASYAELVRKEGAGRVQDPRTLALEAGSPYDDDRVLQWLPMTAAARRRAGAGARRAGGVVAPATCPARRRPAGGSPR